MDQVRTSKRLSLVLIGITLDDAGWVSVPVLLAALAAHGTQLSREQLERVVAGSDKQRFALDREQDRVRANQGHSVTVDLDLPVGSPPEVLFHGTPEGNVASVLREGLDKRQRHHVHLSPDRDTATRVGARRGRPVVLEVRAGEMARAGHDFHVTENGVWLVAAVPPQYVAVDAPQPLVALDDDPDDPDA